MNQAEGERPLLGRSAKATSRNTKSRSIPRSGRLPRGHAEGLGSRTEHSIPVAPVLERHSGSESQWRTTAGHTRWARRLVTPGLFGTSR
jgi:hypothetical protein